MSCQHHKDALIEAAASGAETQGELRTHLDACAACRAAFEQEQSLFASIDCGLHVTANAEVPASLSPRVRSRLDEESALRPIWGRNWLVLASAAVMVVAFFAARAVWHTSITEKPIETAGKANEKPLQNQGPGVVPAVESNSISRRQPVIVKTPSAPERMIRASATPKVLVPRDQEVLLAEYAEQWRLHKRGPLLAQDLDPTVLAPLQVAQIQIDKLDVRLLAEEKSQ
jgi:hypothetical protein